MLLYLVRHGNAAQEIVDPARPLSDEGRAQAGKMAAFLGPQMIEVRAVWHSPKARAAQTAEILATAVRAEEGLVERYDLGPNDPVADVALEIEGTAGDLMIVGHLPFQGLLASRLLSGRDESFVSFDEVTVACLARLDRGRWVLLWLVSPALV